MSKPVPNKFLIASFSRSDADCSIWQRHWTVSTGPRAK